MQLRKKLFSRVLMLTAMLSLNGGDLGRADDIRRDAIVEAVAKVKASVVNINTAQLVEVRDPFQDMFEQFFGYSQRDEPRELRAVPNSLGSGVIIDEEGFILTNTHVVQRANLIQVLIGATNTYDAELIAQSATSDIALLKIKAHNGEKFPAIKFAKDDDLLLGETVIALGNPFGLGLSVSRGILSSTARRPHPDERSPLDYTDWLQTDASVNPGNSGGPLVDLRGELIGINNAVFRKDNAQGISFAIPIKLVGEALSEIFTPENKGFWFGGRVRSDNNQLVMDTVQVGSPADKAGLTPGDAILKVGDKTPRNFISFMVELVKLSEGQMVPMTIEHDGKARSVTVKVVKEETVFNADLVREKLGITVEALSKRAARNMGAQLENGLVISGVDKGSPAARADVPVNVILTGIDDQELTDVKTLAKRLYEKRKGDSVVLNLFAVQRQGSFLFPRAGRVSVKIR